MQGILGTEKGNELVWTAPSEDDPEVRHVYFGMAHFGSYREDDLKARNILVGLIGATSIRRNAIADAFGINRCLVVRYTKEIQEGGVDAVVQDGRGRRPKVTPEMREFVQREFRKLYGKSRKNFTGKLMERMKEKFGVEVSRELIRQIIKPVREKIKQGDSGTRKRSRSLPVLRGSCLPVVYDDWGHNGVELIRRLETGFYSRYAGGLLLNIFIARLTEGIFEDGGDGKTQYGLRTRKH